MSDFDLAIGIVLEHEGGYVNDPNDPGGETKYGISKRSYPKVDIANLTEAEAADIYKRDWWDKYGYGGITAPLVAAKVFDLAVNMGARHAHRCLQRAAIACGENLEDDGLIGPKTLAVVNGLDAEKLMPALRSEAAGRYRVLIAGNKELQRFERGWLKRAYS